MNLISLWKDIVENVNKWMTNCEDVYKWDLGQMGVTRCYKDESVCLELKSWLCISVVINITCLLTLSLGFNSNSCDPALFLWGKRTSRS